MKKLLFIFGAAVILSACDLPIPGRPVASPTAQVQTSDQNAQELSQVTAAIQAGQSANCTMTKKDGTTSINYEVKGRKMKVVTANTDPNQKSGNVISDGQFMYTWNDVEKKGFKIALPSVEDLKGMAQQLGQDVPDFSTQESRQKYQDLGYDVQCDVREIADTDFIPPTDIVFTDMSAMIQKATETLKKATDSLSQEQQAALKQKADQLVKQYGGN